MADTLSSECGSHPVRAFLRSLFSPYYNREIQNANRVVALLVLILVVLVVIALRG